MSAADRLAKRFGASSAFTFGAGGFLVLRDADQQVILSERGGQRLAYGYTDFHSAEVEVIRGSVSTTQGRTSGGLSLTGAIAGGLLFGGAGAVIGGTTKSRTSHSTTVTLEHVRLMRLKLVFRVGRSAPVHFFTLLETSYPDPRAEHSAFAVQEQIISDLECVAQLGAQTRESIRLEEQRLTDMAEAERRVLAEAHAVNMARLNAPKPLKVRHDGRPTPGVIDRYEADLRSNGWRVRRCDRADRDVLLAVAGSERAVFLYEPLLQTRIDLNSPRAISSAYPKAKSFNIVCEDWSCEVEDYARQQSLRLRTPSDVPRALVV